MLSGEARATPKTHDGAVECLRALRVVTRSATKARTQALNQINHLLVTAPEDLRERLPVLPRRELLATCAAFRVRDDDDSLPGVTRLALRELTQRVDQLEDELALAKTRLSRISAAAPGNHRRRTRCRQHAAAHRR